MRYSSESRKKKKYKIQTNERTNQEEVCVYCIACECFLDSIMSSVLVDIYTIINETAMKTKQKHRKPKQKKQPFGRTKAVQKENKFEQRKPNVKQKTKKWNFVVNDVIKCLINIIYLKTPQNNGKMRREKKKYSVHDAISRVRVQHRNFIVQTPITT